MQLLIQNIDELKKSFHYVNDHRIIYEDELLNTYHNNCVFLNHFEEQITNQTKITTEDILYSLYFWGHQFLERANEISYFDAGFEQWHFKIKFEHSKLPLFFYRGILCNNSTITIRHVIYF